jgi:serine-threonine kinase receptor-associated protein
LWDAITGEEKAEFAHGKIVKDICFSPEESHLLSGGHEKILRLWDIERPDAQPDVFPEQTTWVRHLVWNQLQPFSVISSGDDNILRIWDIRTKEIVRELTLEAPVTSLTISRDFKFVTTTSGSKVTFWNAKKFVFIFHVNWSSGVLI